MSKGPVDPTVAGQVELAIGRLDSLSILPCVAVQVFSRFVQGQSSRLSLADIVESDPAVAAKVLSLVHRQGLTLPDGRFSVDWMLEKLGAQLVRNELFSLKVCLGLENNADRGLLRKQLVLHSLAVGCCAEDIAESAESEMDSQLAYLAGLLHDIGKFAIADAMPRSFSGIAEQAKSQGVSTCIIEQKNLGVDHTILGKRLAGKWHFPEQVRLAIWLHHSNTGVISRDMPEARIAQIVQLADLVARQCGIGQSGSYDAPDSGEQIAESLAIDSGQLEQIRAGLAGKVAERSKILGIDLPNVVKNYCEVVHSAAGRLAGQQSELSVENRRLQGASSDFDFVSDFLSSVNSDARPIEIAEKFAAGWQKFYQTGTVCLYLAAAADAQYLEAVVVENRSQSKAMMLKAPAEMPAIPQAAGKNFAIVDAHDSLNWLFEQLDVEFGVGRTKLVPLVCGGKAVGAIVFEFSYPEQTEQLAERFKRAASVGGAVLGMAFSSSRQQRFAEQFAMLVGKAGPEITTREADAALIAEEVSLDTLAEMAGGAAHELNNPLSVISGRAQLLADAESDPKKKRMLEQIRENTGKLSGIIEDLMSFAEPPQPRPSQTDTEQMLDEATHLAGRKQNIEKLDIQIEVADAGKSIFVDSAQVVSAIANIFCNCLESYTNGSGLIKVTVGPNASGDFAKLTIEDFGCGMDIETIKKATQPFFSARPAGRKRGMGLAHAARLVQLNKGSLQIKSQSGSGTTVTILLPCK